MTDFPDRPDEATLMAYIRGRLANDEALAVEQAARERPELRADIALMRGIAAARDSVGDLTPGDPDPGRIPRSAHARPSAALSQGRAGRPALQVAATALLAVGLWQLAIVPMLPDVTRPDAAALPHVPAGSTAFVTFMPGATEAEMRVLLWEIGAEVTGGPGASGLWQLAFPDEKSRAAGLDSLAAATGIVAQVQTD